MTDRYQNNPAELSQQPTWQRDQKNMMFQLTKASPAVFLQQRHLLSAKNCRILRNQAFDIRL
ncbi:MAG: hypothetical protein OQL18_02550 [Deltaproteobacteria bacterium]|nr:hypothetical protein [Deltaproteobacteria bacterium]